MESSVLRLRVATAIDPRSTDSESPMDLRPMLATLADAPLKQKGLVYEPKYDGIRALVEIVPAAEGGDGADLVAERQREDGAVSGDRPGAGGGGARTLKAPVVLDGEIVALDEHGRPAGFQRLQGRMHLPARATSSARSRSSPRVFIAFDILRDGKEDLTRLPLTERRKRLEQLFERIFRLKAEAS